MPVDPLFHRAEGFEHGGGGFRSYAWNAGDVVHGVALEAEDVNDLIHALDVPVFRHFFFAPDFDAVAQAKPRSWPRCAPRSQTLPACSQTPAHELQL